MTERQGDERRIESITMDKIENCVYRALAKFKEKEKEEEIESFRLHQAECPAFQSSKTVKWLISLPLISTVITVCFYYFGKNHGIK